MADSALRQAARLERERDPLVRAVADAEARAEEWSPPRQGMDALLDWWNEIAAAVNGRLAGAQGVADIRATLRDLLSGIWIERREQTLRDVVDVRFALRAPDDAPPEVLVTTFAEAVEFPELSAEPDPRPSHNVRKNPGVAIPPMRVPLAEQEGP